MTAKKYLLHKILHQKSNPHEGYMHLYVEGVHHFSSQEIK